MHVAPHAPDGTFTLTQPGLPKRVPDAIPLSSDDEHPVPTPAVLNTTLSMVKESNSLQGTYNYTHSSRWRPDISHSVSRCPRYTHKLRLSREDIPANMGHYLTGTLDKGLILRPDRDRLFQIDCYIDADFAGLCGHEQPNDHSYVKSYAGGMVICIANCSVILLLWSSKLLQSLIVTSTTEAKYHGLLSSDTMRETIPFRALATKLGTALTLETQLYTIFHTTVHKDKLLVAALRAAPLSSGNCTPRQLIRLRNYAWCSSVVGSKPSSLSRLGPHCAV